MSWIQAAQAALKIGSDNTNRRRAFDSGLAALASSPYSDVARAQAARVNFGDLAQNNSVNTGLTAYNSYLGGQQQQAQQAALQQQQAQQQTFGNALELAKLQSNNGGGVDFEALFKQFGGR